jgi:hypothetical protein
MDPCVDLPMPPFTTPDDITTINYSLEWPHLETPSNTTFAGPIQIDICRCKRTDLPPQKDTEPGHIYTRTKCMGPEVRFKTEQEELWVLDVPHGPINILRPATEEEQARRIEIHKNSEPIVYRGRKLLFLTGPCPRGRYQAYATRRWLEAMTLDARQHVSCLCLLIQPYEEDSSDEATRIAYAEFAEYLVQHVPWLITLHLYICPDGMKMYDAASEFSVLLRTGNTKLVVVDGRCGSETREYSNASVFLEAEFST